MWSHARDYHDGCLGPADGANDYSMKVDGLFRDTLSRQVDEDVRMRLSGWGDDQMVRRKSAEKNGVPKCELMNGKGDTSNLKMCAQYLNSSNTRADQLV